jgi:hypothetical protein
MDEKEIRNAFQKAKQDIYSLNNKIIIQKEEINLLTNKADSIDKELSNMKYDFSNFISQIEELKQLIKNLNTDINNQMMYALSNSPIYILDKNKPTNQQTDKQTIQHINQTNTYNKTNIPTVPQEIKGLKSQNIRFSTGNEGVPTDKQTNQQTDKQTPITEDLSIETNIKEAKIMLDSLDRLKREIRQKFKRLTPQEMIVFSTIYELEETDKDNVTYREVAKKLKLSESSIRDYALRIISKGIPIKKQKIDNKKIILSISPELKKIATLSTIIQLRDL